MLRIAVVDNLIVVWRSLSEEPPRISALPYISRNYRYLHWMFFSGGLRKSHISFLHECIYRPFTVIQGHRFWYESKARCDFL